MSRTFYLTAAGQAQSEDLYRELEKTLGIEVAIVPGHGLNLHTDDRAKLLEAVDIIGRTKITEIAPPLRGSRLTLKLRDVQKHLSNIGMVLKKQDGEYRVSFRVDHRCTRERAESTAYYTDSLTDALETGLRMARDGG